jgi:hypothetical protein
MRAGRLHWFTGRATRTPGLASVVAVALTTLTAVLAPASAAAVVPGTNGPIAFTRGNDIFVMNANGSNQTRLTTASGTDPAFSPTPLASPSPALATATTRST